MKIALVCSHGGHLTEMLFLMKAFEGHECFFITYSSERTESMELRRYLLDNIGKNPIRMSKSFISILGILIREQPNAVVSTGSEIAIPAIILGKLLGMKTIFIESWCRVRTKSYTGKVVYLLSDLFLVQWPQLVEQYGRRAKFEGAVI